MIKNTRRVVEAQRRFERARMEWTNDDSQNICDARTFEFNPAAKPCEVSESKHDREKAMDWGRRVQGPRSKVRGAGGGQINTSDDASNRAPDQPKILERGTP